MVGGIGDVAPSLHQVALKLNRAQKRDRLARRMRMRMSADQLMDRHIILGKGLSYRLHRALGLTRRQARNRSRIQAAAHELERAHKRDKLCQSLRARPDVKTLV